MGDARKLFRIFKSLNELEKLLKLLNDQTQKKDYNFYLNVIKVKMIFLFKSKINK